VTWAQYTEDFETRIDPPMADTREFIGARIERNRPSGLGFPNSTANSVPWGSLCWRTKSSNPPRRMKTVLECIYEEDFLGFSYGFRPERGCHQALDALSVGVQRRKVNWILDADIRGFFDNIDHSWLLKFLEHRIADRRVLRLLKKWLRAGVSEDGQWSPTKVGTPQGAVITPPTILQTKADFWIG
jgi:RNA-directed DNA polymerase